MFFLFPATKSKLHIPLLGIGIGIETFYPSSHIHPKTALKGLDNSLSYIYDLDPNKIVEFIRYLSFLPKAFNLCS